MTTSTRSSRHAHPAYRCARASAVLLGIATASSFVAAPVAQAAAAPKSSSAGICGKISTASVSAIVGYTPPAPTADTTDLPATKQNDEISSVDTSCTYGGYTLAALPKDVILEYVVTSSPLTAAELQKGLAQAQQLHMTFTPIHSAGKTGLGKFAYYYSFTETLVAATAHHKGSVITIQGITEIEGVHEYGAAVYTKTMSESKLAALVKLAEKLGA
jgi:hypothetical protein